ncbi:hypothetical protein [Nitratireductor luteus]|uniref:hypothetical protein n=1 Tax=Nitratireductor luteus TaxID=2976980 RepID=UPI00223F33D1|nr:hypothetical protein [Nitratireductor luteus]
MREKFHELKCQLEELAETVNKFESEAVQLRLVELLFNQTRDEPRFSEPPSPDYQPGPGSGLADWQSGASSRGRPGRPRKTVPSASGAVAALGKLIDSDFFDERRTIGDIVKKCEQEVGVRYKSNAFSGPLSRYAASGVLKRDKNADGKFEYYK